MKNNSVILLETNAAVLQQLKGAFEESQDFTILHAGDDGDVALSVLLREKPDLVIVSMFLKGVDGNGIIQAVKKRYPDTVIVATGVSNDSIIEQAISNGASYYLVRPFSVEVAMERFRELLITRLEEKTEFVVRKKKPVTIEEKISEIFIAIGIPPHIKGYAYLREGIRLTIERPFIINAITKELYPTIALKFGTTASKVERAIRHAIEVAWNRGRIDAINAIFGARIYLGNEKPTNSEFIALVADKLILENMEQ